MTNQEIFKKANLQPIKAKTAPDPAPDFALKAQRRLQYNRNYTRFCDFIAATKNAENG